MIVVFRNQRRRAHSGDGSVVLASSGCEVAAHPVKQWVVSIFRYMIASKPRGIVNADDSATPVHELGQFGHDLVAIVHSLGREDVADENDR